MPVLVRKNATYVPGSAVYAKVAGSWQPGKKLYTKVAGVWREGWPRAPNAPINVALVQTFNTSTDVLEISTSWAAPLAGAEPPSKYQVRLAFTNKTTGVVSVNAWVDKTTAEFSHLFTNAGKGWQHFATAWTVSAQVAAFSGTNVDPLVWGKYFSAVAVSKAETVIDLPIPPAPTSFTATIADCRLTQTWAHVGGNNLTGFQIETWAGTSPHVFYNLAATARSWNQFPWNDDTVGRASVGTRIRAKGEGGYSAWVTITGMMPGPVVLKDYHFRAGRLEVDVYNNFDGMMTYKQQYPNTLVLVNGALGPTTNAATVPYVYFDAASTGYARDNKTQYRLLVRPRNSINGWTGRLQSTAWAIKIPNPVPFTAGSNTWWSQPIPGKWRTNPQADNWMYQGKSISGNSVGTLFYGARIAPYFAVSRLGYDPTVSKMEVYVKRTYTGGLVAAVPISVWTHAEIDDSDDAFPTLVEGPYIGEKYARSEGAWQPIPAGWFNKMQTGAARGVCFYVDFNDPENRLRSEIGDVSNMYMIIDKPDYGAHLDGFPPGTLRIYHDA